MSRKPEKRPMRWASLKKDIAAWILMVPSLFCFIVVLWQPLISGVILSFFETQGYDAVRFIGFDNYIGVQQITAAQALMMCGRTSIMLPMSNGPVKPELYWG